MKKHFVVIMFLAAFILQNIGAQGTSKFNATHKVQTNDGTNLKLRNAPGFNTMQIDSLENGSYVKVLDTGSSAIDDDGNRGNWVYVQTAGGKTGWCFNAYLLPVSDKKTSQAKTNKDTNTFNLDWFDISTPGRDRKACLVSSDYGREGYNKALELVKQNSKNKAVFLAEGLGPTEELLVILEKQDRTEGTYLAVIDGPYLGINTWYCILCFSIEKAEYYWYYYGVY